MLPDCYNSLIYPIFTITYIVLFSFFFDNKLETIVFIAIFVTSFFFVVKLYLDIFYFTTPSDFSLQGKYLCMQFLKHNIAYYLGMRILGWTPVSTFLFISVILLFISQLMILAIFSTIKTEENHALITASLSRLNKRNMRIMKIITVICTISCLILAILFNYFDNNTFCENRGSNTMNCFAIFACVIALGTSIYLVKMSNGFYGISSKMTDAVNNNETNQPSNITVIADSLSRNNFPDPYTIVGAIDNIALGGPVAMENLFPKMPPKRV